MFTDSMPQKIAAIYDTDGTELTERMVLELLTRVVPAAEDPASEVGKEFPIRMRVNTVGWTAKDESGALWPIDHILAEGNFTTIETRRPIQRHRYARGGRAYSVASADAPIGHRPGKIVFMQNEDGSSSVYWTAEVADRR